MRGEERQEARDTCEVRAGERRQVMCLTPDVPNLNGGAVEQRGVAVGRKSALHVLGAGGRQMGGKQVGGKQVGSRTRQEIGRSLQELRL